MFIVLVLFEKEVQKFRADTIEKVREFLDFFDGLLPPGRIKVYQLTGKHRNHENMVIRFKRSFQQINIC